MFGHINSNCVKQLKQDIHIEVYEKAISELDVASILKNQLKKLEVKRAKTYFR